MAKDLGDTIGSAVGRVAREAVQNVAQDARKSRKAPLGGMTGVALGAGLAAAAPLAVKGASKLRNGLGNGAKPLQKPVQKAGEKVKGAASDVVDKKVQDIGGAGGIAKEGVKSLIPGLGGDEDRKGDKKGKGGEPGVGKGRRMPVQQSVDIGAPISNVYNEFTQFEEWPRFMHRVTSVSQEDETHVAFKSKIWGVSKEFEAEIDEQRPDERIKWHVVEGLNHKGVATFHELAPRLTRIEVSVDVEPGSLIEKFARGARHVKRAMRADLHRFKAYVMFNEKETGEWRGRVEDGEVKSSQRSSAASSGSRSRRSGSSSGSGRSKAASSSSGRSRSSSGSSRSSSGSSRSSSGSSRSSSGSKRSSSDGSSKRSTRRSSGSNGGDPSSRSRSRPSSSSNRRKSGSRS